MALLYIGVNLSVGYLPLVGFLGQQRCNKIQLQIGTLGLLWLSFVTGQGLLGLAWLLFGLVGFLLPWIVWTVCTFGWTLTCIMMFRLRRRFLTTNAPSFLKSGSRYYCLLGMSIVLVSLLRGVISLLPPANDDALVSYLPMAKMIAESSTVKFQPFVRNFYGLLPLQVEMHWAALFLLSNETAVTFWDYLCGMSFLCGIGLLGWSLTGRREVALLSMIIVLSTPGFYDLLGQGKVDNAAAQYGIATFLWLVLSPVLGGRSLIAAGLCFGWALASRYQDVILAPAVILFTLIILRQKPTLGSTRWSPFVRVPVQDAVVFGIGAAFAGVPMLIKNWLLVECPLAPHIGCTGTFWAESYRAATSAIGMNNISETDLILYPFVWTFADRPDMYGNISPLFLGVVPLILIYYRSSLMQSSFAAGVAGLASLGTWLLMFPQILATRYVLVPLGLVAVWLGTSGVAAEPDVRQHTATRWLIGSAILVLLLFFLVQSRGVVYGLRYLASVDSREDRYASVPRFSYDMAAWLNEHVKPRQRVALDNCCTYRYFLNANILLNSESQEELQWLWERGNRPSHLAPEVWQFYRQRGFTYVGVPRARIDDALKTLKDHHIGAEVAFKGKNEAVLRIGGA